MPPADQITGGFSHGVDFLSSALAGMVIGLLLDWWLGTAPIFVVIGVVAGFTSGFYKAWRYSEIIEQQAQGRSHGR